MSLSGIRIGGYTIRRRIPPDYFFFSEDALYLTNKTKFKKKLKKYVSKKSPGLLRLRKVRDEKSACNSVLDGKPDELVASLW